MYLLLISLFSCNSKSQDDSIQFNVDESLLEEKQAIDSLSFSFSPPIGWLSDPAKVVNLSRQKFTYEELNTYSIDIKDFFRDSSSTNFCSLSIIQSTGTADLEYFVYNYNLMLSGQLLPENLKQTSFNRSGLNIFQFLIMTDSIIYFKLFFQTSEKYFIQLDYAIDRSIYPSYIKKIESSIGSITNL